MWKIQSHWRLYKAQFHALDYAPAKTGEYPSDIPQFPKLEGFKFAIKINIKMGEQFAFVTEEEINLLVDKAVPENTKLA